MFSWYNADGLSVIPLRARRKNPVLSGWQKYSKELATKELARLWDDLYTVPERGNIGLCPGPASGVMAVDIDTDDQRTHKSVPDSPFRRVGKPGREVRLYKYNPAIKSMKDHSRCIEVFADSGQIVLPPSIHPDTNEPYRWIGEMRPLDDEWREHLPEMPNLNWLERCPIINDGSDPTKVTGRNNRLTEVVCHIFSRGESVEYAIQEALKIDQEEHAGNEYFLDESDTYAQQAGGNREEAARLFCEDHYRRMKRKGMVPEPVRITIDLKNMEETAKQVFVPLPRAPGLINDIIEDINRSAIVQQPNLAYGAALSIVSVCSSGRYTWKRNMTNLFVMNVATASSGKGHQYNYIREVLGHDLMRGENLYGLKNWISAQAIVQGFPKQRNRIDLHDELSGFLSDVASGNTFREQAMLELNELYSIGGGFYPGLKSIGSGDVGMCYGPGLTVLASIQPETFVDKANAKLFDNGFLKRFLFFISNSDRKLQTNRSEIKTDWLVRRLKETILHRPALYREGAGFDVDVASLKPNALVMHESDSALKKYNEAFQTLFDMEAESHRGRLCENFTRLCIISALSCGRTRIENEDIDWAFELVSALSYNSERLLKEASGGSFFDKQQSSAMTWLVEKKQGTCTRKEFFNRFSRLTPKQRKELLEALKERGLIVENGQVITAAV